MNNDLSTSSASNVHVINFVTSYAKCWEEYEAYMQNPDHTYKGFIAACKAEAKARSYEIKLPADRTFENRTAKLKQAGLIPERTVSDKPDAVRQRKHRASVTNPRIGEMSQPPSESQSSTAVDSDILPPLLEHNDPSPSESGTVSVLPSDREPDFPDLESQRDYEFAIDLIEQLKAVMSKNRHGYERWHEFYWLSLKQEISVAHSFAANKSSRADASIRRNCEEVVQWASDAIRGSDKRMGS